MKLSLVIASILFATWATPVCAKTAVVVIAISTGITDLSSIEVRKAYFAIPTTKNGYQIIALRNEGDTQLNRVFLQALVSMTEIDYDRRLLALATQNGRQRPRIIYHQDELISILTTSPGHISIVWLDQLTPKLLTELHVVRVLWQSS